MLRPINPLRLFVTACLLFHSSQALALPTEPASLGSSGFPQATSKKGLQVEDIQDAIQLGVKHATFNVLVPSLLANGDQPKIETQGRLGSHAISEASIRALDQKIKPLSDSGALVYLILLNSARGGKTSLLTHPDFDSSSPNGYSAFNVKTDAAKDQLETIARFIANRYSKTQQAEKPFPNGRVAGYIIGNEVNSHWWWHNRGPVSMTDFVKDYAEEFEVITRAIESQSDWARTYISLDHYWTASHSPDRPDRCFGSKAFLESFAAECKNRNDLRWHVAFHPYPQNLFEPSFWNDQQATFDDQSPKITFRNIVVLRDWMRRPDMLLNGKPRSIIFSEQGFHCKKGVEGELLQAAAYCYAYSMIEAMEGIDAFILHRHIDHPKEGGLRVGLYGIEKQDANGAYTRLARKIRSCFAAAGTPNQEKEFEFALPFVGLSEWPNAPPNKKLPE